MRVFVFADRLGRELVPLTEHTSTALLPIAGKAVVEHVVESIAVAKLNDINLVIANHNEQFKQLLADGRRWGIKINYLLSRGEELPSDILTRYRITADDGILALRADIICSHIVDDFLEKIKKLNNGIIYGGVQEKNIVIGFLREGLKGLDKLAWQNIQSTPNNEELDSILNLDKGKISYLESLNSYHQANLDAASDQFINLIIPGRRLAENLRVGRDSRVSTKNAKQGWAFIGSGCQIHHKAELIDKVVISDHVVVDKQATLRHSVILPYTYIGELTNIENAIVSSNNLIRVDTNTVLKITDAFLLADLKESPINNNLSIVVNSLSGIILLFLSLPLWPVAFVFSLFQEPPKLMQKLTLRGNRLETGERGIFKRKNFTAWYWTTAIPILRNLPLLFPVIAGHLRIVGTLPLTPAQADRRTEDWELLSDKMPAGLIGPTTLQIPANAPIEEKLMSDAFYVQQHNFHKDLKYILLAFKTIFSHRAWMRFDTLDEHRN